MNVARRDLEADDLLTPAPGFCSVCVIKNLQACRASQIKTIMSLQSTASDVIDADEWDMCDVPVSESKSAANAPGIVFAMYLNFGPRSLDVAAAGISAVSSCFALPASGLTKVTVPLALSAASPYEHMPQPRTSTLFSRQISSLHRTGSSPSPRRFRRPRHFVCRSPSRQQSKRRQRRQAHWTAGGQQHRNCDS